MGYCTHTHTHTHTHVSSVVSLLVVASRLSGRVREVGPALEVRITRDGVEGVRDDAVLR